MAKRVYTCIKSEVSAEFKKKVLDHVKKEGVTEAHFVRQCVTSVVIGVKKL